MAKITHIDIEGLDIELTTKPGTRNITLSIKPPEGIISVSAPSGVPLEIISEFILSNIENITKAREKISARPRYITGEKFCLWGKNYILDVQQSAGRAYSIKQSGEKIIMAVPEDSSHKGREGALNELCRREVKRVLPEIIKICAGRVGVQVNSFSVRNMKTCWGTCHIKRKHIIINLQLAKKPPECLEYVVVHELVHLLEKNHTKRFHELVAKNFPDEGRVKTLLSDYQLGI